MNSEMFHLVFNNFGTSISKNWMELREETDFYDVTLGCEGRRVEAHKLILSSCSPVLRDLLLQTRHPHPMLYLRGIKFSQIASLLDFIYMGEVNIAREELDDFLEVARELKVKGLTEDKSKEDKEYSARELRVKSLVEDKKNRTEDRPNESFPAVYTSVVKDEYEDLNQKQEDCYHGNELNYEPEIKMEEQDYCEVEDGNFDGDTAYLPMKSKCEFCYEVVSRIGDDYKNHLKLVHDVNIKKEKRGLACPDCFERKEDYMDVRRCQRKHRKDKSWTTPTEFECNDGDCSGVSFQNKKAFLKHLRNHHKMLFKPTNKPDHWICIYCEKLYASDRSLKNHEDICHKNPVNSGRNCKRGPKHKSVNHEELKESVSNEVKETANHNEVMETANHDEVKESGDIRHDSPKSGLYLKT